ncbi:MAG: hypothetical protein JSW06_04580 [Thermoplasmatales archaeon]|nr:MAG: hypothetical protein JSW06_04580 [Thermoplasmatales archaeon]
MNTKNKIYTIMKACVITFILLFVSCSNLTLANSSISNAEDAARFVIERLSYDIDEVLLYAWGPISKGEEIFGTKEHILNTPEKGYVIYIDIYPRANLFHPVKYIFLSESAEEFIVKDAMSPPGNFADYQMIKTAIGTLLTSVENRRAPIPDGAIPALSQRSTDSRYAVLMNGGYSSGSNHVRYWNDLSNIYITLNYVYGFPDENIIVLCSDGLNPAPDQSNGLNSDPDLDGDGDDDIMYSCILSNVDMVFAELANILTENDKLFIFTTDHGSSAGGWNVVQNLWNYEELTDAHFAALLDALPNCEIICTFEPCYSGGFLDDVVVPPGPVMASSACRHDELSWAMNNLEYDEYVFHWTAAIKGEDAYGIPVDADYNQDGRITMDEAYLYAKTHDIQNEHPQYGDYPVNIGSLISLYPTNLAPEDPLKPVGPGEGIILEEYSFSSNTTDPEGEQIYYWFDWGDSSNTGWLGPFASGTSIEESHIWYDSGNYSIKVKAKDEKGSESGWSEPLTIHIAKPVLEIGLIKDGFLKVTAPVRNNGDTDANDVSWNINLQGGIIFLGKETTGTILSIPPGGDEIISTDIILGFGQTTIFVTAEEPRGSADNRDQGAKMFLFFINVNPGGGI